MTLVSTLALSAIAVVNSTVIVTPDNLSGWTIGTFSPHGRNSGQIWIGQAPLARAGVGSLWYSTGNGNPANPFVYARSDHYKGKALFDLELFAYQSFVSPQSASRWAENGIGFFSMLILMAMGSGWPPSTHMSLGKLIALSEKEFGRAGLA